MGEIEMGKILTMRPRAATPRRAAAEGPAESARILFFTGVRYERAAAYVPVTGPEPDDRRAGAARKRKRRA